VGRPVAPIVLDDTATGTGAQAPAAALAFAPSSSTANVGATILLDVTVANVAASPGLGGYDISLTFNPAVVRLETLTDAGLLTGGSNIVICVPAQIDNVAGKRSRDGIEMSVEAVYSPESRTIAIVFARRGTYTGVNSPRERILGGDCT